MFKKLIIIVKIIKILNVKKILEQLVFITVQPGMGNADSG